MNEALKEMSKDGSLTKLSKQFFNKADVSKKLMPTFRTLICNRTP